MAHNLGENVSILTLAAGTVNSGGGAGSAGGTIMGVVSAGLYEQHLVAYFGTFANHGTINVYGCTNAGGSSPVVLQTLNVGSANAPVGMGWAGIMVKSDTLNGLQGGTLQSGTQFTHLSACGTCESGGTWRGALVIISTGLRNAPAGTNNAVALGSVLV